MTEMRVRCKDLQKIPKVKYGLGLEKKRESPLRFPNKLKRLNIGARARNSCSKFVERFWTIIVRLSMIKQTSRSY